MSRSARKHCPTCTCLTQASLTWALAPEIAEPLAKTRFAGLVGDERWWRAQFRAHPGVRFEKEILEAEAWCCSNPRRAPHRDYRRFLNEWFRRASDDP